MVRSPTVDAVMAAERAASFTKRSIKKSAKETGLILALSMLDLTTLEGKDSPEKVRALCRKAVLPDPNRPQLPSVAAVCVYPALVAVARQTLAGSNVKVASVATGFPSGQFPIQVRLEDVRRAVQAGAHEIDMVINRGAYLAGRFDEVCEEIRTVKRACMAPPRGTPAAEFHPAHLKVILETGELETLDDVRRASDLAIRAMADVDDEFERQGVAFAHTPIDFIKTSTGKVQPAATMPVTLVMLEAIRDWYVQTGRKVGMKPAGGIRTAKQALHYLVMVRETLGFLEGGDAWLTPAYFRFGASTLCNDILRQLEWLRRGTYMAAYDFTES
jgi:deoxyribose-phosphate aldolase